MAPDLSRIVVDPSVLAGKPIIRNTRIPVELVLKMLAQGISESEILTEYPRLTLDDIHAALEYAARLVAAETVFPFAAAA